jgi:hypothetical protein
MSRINLVTNPSFKTSSTGWSATGSSTIARITTDAFYGSSCLRITKAAAANSGVVTSTRIAVTAASVYSVSAYVKVPDNQETGTLRIDVKWYTAVSGGSLISTSSTNSIEVPTGSDWTRLMGTMTAPALAVGATISIVQPSAGTVSKTFLVDAVLLENAAYVGEYFDDITQAYENTQVNLGLTPLPIPHITGMQLNADIAIGDLILNTIDENGVVWVCTDIEGWWVHPEPEVRDIPRGWGDGSYDVRGRYMARQLTLNGVFLTPDPSLVQVSRDKLIKETDLVYVGAWIKVDEEPTKASYVRLSGRPNIQTVNARGRTEFSIGLRAPDPLKYEWYPEDELGYRYVTIQGQNSGVSGSGAGTVTNTGNAYAPVVLQITGPLTGPATILNQTTNESITIIESLSSGQVLEIDTRDHVVTLDGDSVGKRSLVDVLAEWTLLAPGDNYFTFVDDGDSTSDASLAIYYRSAWLG